MDVLNTLKPHCIDQMMRECRKKRLRHGCLSRQPKKIYVCDEKKSEFDRLIIDNGHASRLVARMAFYQNN